MKIIFTAAILFLASLLISETTSAQVLIDLTLKYNLPLNKYEVYGKARGPVTINTGGSSITVVLPASAINTPLSVTTVGGGTWGDGSQIYAPGAKPGNDFHSISTIGSPITFPNAATEVLLFTFTHSPCIEGARLFVDGVDPGPLGAGMLGSDFASYIVNSATVQDHTGIPYDNFGTVCATLPVILTSFTGLYNGSQTDLSWETSSEVNTSHFEIERSTNGIDFKKIGQVKAVNGNARPSQYSYTDPLLNISGAMIYYRLRMVDIDGKFFYSKVINFALNTEKSGVGVYPNPVIKGENINLLVSLKDIKKVSADIIDMHGKLIHQISMDELRSKSIRTDILSSGIYFIRFNINGTRSAQKIMVQ